MTTGYPTSLDTFVNPQSSDLVTTISHAGQHDNINDSMAAVQTKLGVNSSAVTSTIDYLLKNTASVDPGHKHTGSSVSISGTANAVTKINNAGTNITATGISVDDTTNAIYGYSAKINAQSGTTYTLQASDNGKIVELSNASAITLTFPNSLAAGFQCTLAQTGAGQVTFSAASGATLHNQGSFTKLAGQWAMATAYVHSNSGTNAVYVWQGAGA